MKKIVEYKNIEVRLARLSIEETRRGKGGLIMPDWNVSGLREMELVSGSRSSRGNARH